MPHRTLAAMVLTVLVVTSGCLGILGMSDESGPTPATAAEPTPTPTPTPETTTLEGLDSDHRRALMNSSGWRLDSTLSISMNGSESFIDEISIEEQAKIDRENHRYWRRATGLVGATVKYTNRSLTVQRIGSGDAAQYSYKRKPYENGSQVIAMQPVNLSKATGADLLLIDENVTYVNKGTTSVDGVNATKYVVANASDIVEKMNELGGGNATFGETTRNVSVEKFSSSMYVGTDRRIVHRAEWSITVIDQQRDQRVSINVSLEVSEIGDVNVSRPDWMAKALEGSEDESVSLIGGSENESACSFYSTDIETEKIRLNNGSYRVRVHVEDWGSAEAIHLKLDGERQSTVREKWTDAEVPNTSIVVPDDTLVQATATSQDCPEGRLLEFISVG